MEVVCFAANRAFPYPLPRFPNPDNVENAEVALNHPRFAQSGLQNEAGHHCRELRMPERTLHALCLAWLIYR